MTNAQSKIKTAIKLLAPKRDILIQAQKGDVELTADKKINITACKEKLTASAGKEFLLQSGGGYIKISGGNIDIHCPGKLSMKAKNFVHTRGGGGSVDAPTMPNDDYNPIQPGIAGFDNTTFLGGMANGVLNQLAVVTNKITRNDGRIVQPFTGVEVSKPDQQDAAFNNLVSMGGILNKAANFTKPLGKVFKGTIHRLEEPARTGTTWDVHKWNVAANHRYSGPGYGATYGSTTAEVALAEVEHYGVSAGRVAVSKEVSVNNLLDLTDDSIIKKLGITREQITKRGDYEITQKIGNWAREEGYDAILAPSAQSHNGSNLIIFPEH